MREIVELSGGASGSTKARIANQERAFRPFPEARAFVHKLDLKGNDAWGTYAKSGRKPQDIPASPNKAYDSSEWRGWSDWLGVVNRWNPVTLIMSSLLEEATGVNSLSTAGTDCRTDNGMHCRSIA